MSEKTFADWIYEWRKKRYKKTPLLKTEDEIWLESFRNIQDFLKKRREAFQLSKL
jgi:hypothetical protein